MGASQEPGRTRARGTCRGGLTSPGGLSPSGQRRQWIHRVSSRSKGSGPLHPLHPLTPCVLQVENEGRIKRELKEQPGRLQFLAGIVTDLYLDKYKFKGQNVAAQAPTLQRLLQQDYSLPMLLQFFDQR